MISSSCQSVTDYTSSAFSPSQNELQMQSNRETGLYHTKQATPLRSVSLFLFFFFFTLILTQKRFNYSYACCFICHIVYKDSIYYFYRFSIFAVFATLHRTLLSNLTLALSFFVFSFSRLLKHTFAHYYYIMFLLLQ